MKFTILKGLHYSFPFFIKPHVNITDAHFNIKFDKNCWYERENVEFTGINKLCGLGFGFDHHNNSIRVGWQPDFDKKDIIKLYAYWYDGSQEGYQKEFLCDVKTNKWFIIYITINGESYILNTNVDPNSVEVFETHDKNWGFWLRPYFGGKSRAPQKMKIWIKK